MGHPQAAKHPQISELKWVAVDLDGTIAETVFTATNPDPRIGAPRLEAIEKILELFYAGYDIVVHTSRPWSDYKAIATWLAQVQVPDTQRRAGLDHVTYAPLYDYVSAIQCGKLLAAVYVDDRARHESEKSWLP